MRKELAMLFLAIASVLILSSCGQGDGETQSNSIPESATGETKEFTIVASNFEFDVTEVRVNQGDTVEITLKSSEGFHAFEIEGYGIEIQEGKTVSFVADQVGEYQYICSIFCGIGHGEMIGTLVVE